MPDVFISYSRQDTNFVRQLHVTLTQTNRDAWVDWEDIPLTADWWQEIQSGIETAHTFIFVISPSSMTSPVCHLEIEHARRHNKRMVPIMYLPVDETNTLLQLAERKLDDLTRQRLMGQDLQALGRSNWHGLSRHNWLFFRDGDDFDAAFQNLLDALDTDIDHAHEHTRLLIRALEWQDNQREASYLMDGLEIDRAETWLTTGVGTEPLPTELHAEYISASRQRANRRQRRLLVGTATALIVALSLAALSFTLFQQSEERLFLQQIAQATSEQRGTEVAQQAATSEANLVSQWRTQSLFLADLARQELDSGIWHNALNLGLESIEHRDRFLNPESYQLLSDVLAAPGQEVRFFPMPNVNYAAWSDDETHVVIATRHGLATVWNAQTGEQRRKVFPYQRYENSLEENLLRSQLPGWEIGGTDLDDGPYWIAAEPADWSHDREQGVAYGESYVLYILDTTTLTTHLALHEAGIEGVLWSHNDTEILAWDAGGTARIWDAQSGLERLLLRHPEERITGALWKGDDSQILTYQGDMIYIWDAVTGTVDLTLQHAAWVDVALWTEDGTRIIASTSKNQITAWDSQTGSELYTTQPIDNGGSIIWSLDQNRFLVSSATGTVSIFDAQTGEELSTIKTDSRLQSAIWSADKTRVLIGTNGSIIVWDMVTHAELFSLSAVQAGAIWNQDKSRVLTWSGNDNTVRVWDIVTGAELLTLHHPSRLTAALWNQDESQIMTQADDGVRIWDANVSRRFQHNGSVSGADWSQNENQILSWSWYDRTVRVWNTSTGAERLNLLQPQYLDGAMWNQDETRILTWAGGSSNVALVWDAQTGDELLRLQHQLAVQGAAWSRDSSRILTWSSDDSARVWDVDTGIEQMRLQHQGAVENAAWDRDETRILTYNNPDTFFCPNSNENVLCEPVIKVWNAQNGDLQLQIVLEHSNFSLVDVAWSRDGDSILSTSRVNNPSTCNVMVQVWDAGTGEERVTLEELAKSGGTCGTFKALWNNDDSQILTWLSDGNLSVWDAKAGTVQLTLALVEGIAGAQWNSNETRIIAWGSGIIMIWDANTGELLHRLQQEPPVNGVRLSNDETRIVTWSGNAAAVWDIESGDQLASVRHLARLDGARWNANDTRILTWAIDGQLKIWMVDINELVKEAEQRRLRPLNNLERETYFLGALEPTATSTSESPEQFFTISDDLAATLQNTTSTLMPSLTPSATLPPSATLDWTPTSAPDLLANFDPIGIDELPGLGAPSQLVEIPDAQQMLGASFANIYMPGGAGYVYAWKDEAGEVFLFIFVGINPYDTLQEAFLYRATVSGIFNPLGKVKSIFLGDLEVIKVTISDIPNIPDGLIYLFMHEDIFFTIMTLIDDEILVETAIEALITKPRTPISAIKTATPVSEVTDSP